MILSIGEILVDIFPKYQRIGGAPFNFACHLKNLRFPVRFLSRVGSDERGKDILNFVANHGFSSEDIEKDIQIDKTHKTGMVHVSEEKGQGPQFDIVKDVAYDYLEWNYNLEALLDLPPRIIYWGTLIQRTADGFSYIEKLLKNKKPETKGFFDINLRPECYTKEAILQSLEFTDILKLNMDELYELSGMLAQKNDADHFVNYLKKTYNIEWVALTKGGDGSTLYTKEGIYTHKPEKKMPTEDTVGAGDAYASVLAAGYINQWPPSETLERAASFASSICMQKGAIPENNNFYEPFLKRFKIHP